MRILDVAKRRAKYLWRHIQHMASQHTITFWLAWIGFIAVIELTQTILVWLAGS